MLHNGDMMNKRSLQMLDVRHYANPTAPAIVQELTLIPPTERQYIMRMLVHRPELGWKIPHEMEWLRPAVDRAIRYQAETFGQNTVDDRFIYITIRHGEVTSVSDDEWHADGFSMRIHHAPEQNYIWSNHTPSEFYNKAINVPSDFDAMKHNIHKFFQDVIPEDTEVDVAPPNTLVVFDTYHIHRRPSVPVGTHRTMFRISFVPIQIKTDDCMQNPAFPIEIFDRSDIRTTLGRYPVHL